MLKLAIVGSHELTYFQRLTAAILVQGIIFVYRTAPADVDITIVSGGAKGVDHIAETTAHYLALPTEIYYPANPQWEPEGYKDRNIKIAEACDVLWCIRARDSLTFGSEFTAGLAEKLGKQVYRVWV